MKSAKLALNRWNMGQVLMPTHLFTLQDTLLQHVGFRAQLQGLPGYGIAGLFWDDALISKGAIAISSMTAVFPSGDLIDVPGNATVSNLNLGDFQDDRAAVYLHVFNASRDAGEVDTSDVFDEDSEAVERLVHRVELSLKPWLDEARQSMKLAELEREMGSDWRLGTYVPPLLQVGTSPFLLSHVDSYESSLRQLQVELAAQLVDPYLGEEHAGRLRRGHGAVRRLQTYLADLRGQVHLHPYYFLDALRHFYVELCILQRTTPDAPLLLYDHDDLAGCFGQMADRLRDKLAYAPITSERLSFTRDDYYYLAAPFPEELGAARRVYLVVRTADASGESDIDLTDVIKLASPGRLGQVHSLSLPGVAMERLQNPGFSHTFGVRSRFYSLDLGDEWQHAVREGALCYYARDEINDLETALTWHR